MAKDYGNLAGTTNSKFRVVCDFSYADQNNGYYKYTYKLYVQVTTGNFYSSNITSSWGKTFTISGVGTYGTSTTYTKNVAYGANFTLGTTAYAQYTRSSGAVARSEIGGSTILGSVPNKTYTITFNANGGSGAPGKQTKYYGKTLKLSSTKPTRTGYTFQGWGTSTTDTTVDYAAGANYTANASDTLYAIWKANTYAVSYNANGGSGAPGNQTKTYGTALTLSSTKPTRTNYNFKGWGTSASATTVAYDPGDSYTSNSAITLYAIWELAYTPPTITNLQADRCTSSGVLDEEGSYAKVTFTWSCSQLTGTNNIKNYTVKYGALTHTETPSGTSGNAQVVVGGSLSTDSQYEITVTVTDSKNGSSTATVILPTTKFILDFKAGGTGLAIGKAAQEDDLFDIWLKTHFNKQVVFKQNVTSGVSGSFPAFLIESDLADTDTFYRATRTDTGTSVALGVGAAGENHGVWSTTLGAWMIYCGESGSVQINSNGNLILSAPSQGINDRRYGENVVLWSGGYYMSDTQTISLSQAISAQPSGAIFAWSSYDGSTAQNYNWDYYFVPKHHVIKHNRAGISFFNALRGMYKYVYVSDTSAKGHANNDASGASNGIVWNNRNYVLRYVIGV